MKRFLLAPVLLALAACSTTGSSSGRFAGLTVWDPPADPLVRPLKAGERTPAGAPRVNWVPSTKNISVGPQGGVAQFELDINRVQEWEEQEAFQDVRTEMRVFWEPGTCQDWDCSAGGGDSALWNAFYGAPRERKAQALADAIKGVGVPSAEKLIASGVFHRKPRSWSDFKAAMQRAEQTGHIGRDIVYQATVKYANDNLMNLGYTTGSCSPRTYTCDILVERLVSVPFTNYRTVTRSQVIDSHRRGFEIHIRDPKLQNFEQDTVELTAGREPNEVSVTAGPYTTYSSQMNVQGNVTRIELIGGSRNLVALPQGVFGNAKYENRGGSATFSLTVDPRYIPKPGSNDQLVLKYKVKTQSCNRLGLCMGKSEYTQDMFQPITSAETTITIPNMNKKQSWVFYTIARKNSPWYNDTYLPERQTDDLKIKK